MLPVLAVVGCTTTSDRWIEVPHLKGEPMKVVFDRIGPPDKHRVIANKNVYRWSHQIAESYPSPTSRTPTTNINVKGSNVSAAELESRYSTWNLFCTVTVVANQNNIVEGFEWEGNIGGCAPYAGALRGEKVYKWW